MAALPVICSVGDSDITHLAMRAGTALARNRWTSDYRADAKRCQLVRAISGWEIAPTVFSRSLSAVKNMQPRLGKLNDVCRVFPLMTGLPATRTTVSVLLFEYVPTAVEPCVNNFM